LYWKCQLIGWTLYIGVPIVFAISQEPEVLYEGDSQPQTFHKTFFYYLFLGIKLIILGVIISHLMRMVIKKIRVLDKPISKQIFYFLGLTILFTIIFDIGTWVSVHGFAFFRITVEEIERGRIIIFIIQGLTFFAAFVIWYLIYFIYHYIQKAVSEEKQKADLKIQMLELEAKALRAQMNPHFIFNCMNSIKALIQNDDKQRSIEYLTTFSKLIRTLFQNSDKRQISLYDEIETCRLYTQLEAMRLSGKLEYNFEIDPNLDLKSVMVPALIMQPFIENAIWHGIVPKEEGTIRVTVNGNGDSIICEVNDDGIGRKMSKLNKPVTAVVHESKGVRLSQARLNLEKMLNDNNASIEIIDKYEEDIAKGTKVVIEFLVNR